MKILFNRIISQDIFVSTNNNKFSYKGNDFYFIGFNAYYLQSEAAKGNNYIVDEVFETARKLKVKVIRTWGFYETDSPSNKSAIRFSPDTYNEKSLEALDYIIHKAHENNIKLIITLGNALKHFGGVPQYVNWANNFLKKKFSDFKYEDFFTDEEIKGWYKNYISTILNRINTYNLIQYKNDPVIFSWELLNEAEIPNENYRTLYNWYDEMGSFLKSIDPNHIITTGEIGYDFHKEQYSDVKEYYNNQKFLIDGSKGTSFFENIKIPNVDYASFHLYPDGWNFTPDKGNYWIIDHHKIAEANLKPALLSEFGIKTSDKKEVYKDWFKTISSTESRSALIWHYVHKDVKNIDGYGFNEQDVDLIDLIKNYAESLDKSNSIGDQNDEIILYQNYPNPAANITNIKYSLLNDENIKLELYNSLGEKISTLDEGEKQKGTHEISISFEDSFLASGIYFYSLKTGKYQKTKKMILLK